MTIAAAITQHSAMKRYSVWLLFWIPHDDAIPRDGPTTTRDEARLTSKSHDIITDWWAHMLATTSPWSRRQRNSFRLWGVVTLVERCGVLFVADAHQAPARSWNFSPVFHDFTYAGYHSSFGSAFFFAGSFGSAFHLSWRKVGSFGIDVTKLSC